MSANMETEANSAQGIGWPGLYDLLVLLLTRGRDGAYRKALIDLAGMEPGSHVLDVGCGTGTLAIEARRRVGPGSVTGTDISEPMLAAARRKARRANSDITFVQAEASRLPFDDRRFDVVLMTTVMHMVPAGLRGKSIAEIARVLKPGGRALLVDYAGLPETRRSFAARHGPHGRFDLHAHISDMEASGFANVETGPLGWLDLHFLRGEAG